MRSISGGDSVGIGCLGDVASEAEQRDRRDTSEYCYQTFGGSTNHFLIQKVPDALFPAALLSELMASAMPPAKLNRDQAVRNAVRRGERGVSLQENRDVHARMP